MPLLLDIATFLISKNVAEGDGKDIFRDFVPEDPDNIIVMMEYSGDPASPHDSALHRSVQILARNKDADAARQKAVSIFEAFRQNQTEDGRVDLTSTRWGQIYLRQPPFMLKRDNNQRTFYAFNMGITTTIE